MLYHIINVIQDNMKSLTFSKDILCAVEPWRLDYKHFIYLFSTVNKIRVKYFIYRND